MVAFFTDKRQLERGWEKGRKPASHKKASLMNRVETVMYFNVRILTGLS